MSKRLSKEDRELIAAEHLGGLLCSIPAVDEFMSKLIKDKGARNVLAGAIALKAINSIKGKKRVIKLPIT